MRELFDLIHKNRNVIQHPFLASVIKQLPLSRREAWNAVITVASGASPTDPLGKSLALIRHKVLAHYGPKAILVGYKHHFLSANTRDDRAFISRGDTAKDTRFYFADAAAHGYLRSIVGKDKSEGPLMMDIAKLLGSVNHALMGIVVTFIQTRGYGYRAVTDE
jgi:hypothetical protein